MLFLYRLKDCKFLQLESEYARAGESAFKLLKFYEKRINKAFSKVKLIFTLVDLTIEYFKLACFIAITRSYKKSAGVFKLLLYKSLCNLCILLIAYSALKKSKASGVDDVFNENFTLASILSLSKKLQNKKYFPNPTKRLFIPKANGKMSLLGITPSKDKIL